MYDSNYDDNTTMICNILLFILHIYIYIKSTSVFDIVYDIDG